MAIHRASLRHNAYKIGGYVSGGSTHAPPVLRVPATGAAADFNNTYENTHFTCNTVTYGYTVTQVKPGLRSVSFGPPAGAPAAELCYYLPYRDNNITSVVLGAAADTFFTDNLSGCSIFIDRTAGGDIVVYHANRQGAAYSPTVEQRRNFSFEREVAVAVKHVQHDEAQRTSYAGATNLGSLFKKRYMADAAQHEAILRFGGQGDSTIYGTTVVGFRRGGNWLFWYQTWKCDMQGNNYAIIKAEQFYP